MASPQYTIHLSKSFDQFRDKLTKIKGLNIFTYGKQIYKVHRGGACEVCGTGGGYVAWGVGNKMPVHKVGDTQPTGMLFLFI